MNNDIIDRFVEAQIPNGKSFDLGKLTWKFDGFFKKLENRPLVKYRDVLMESAKIYDLRLQGKTVEVPDSLAVKLKEFIANYKAIKTKPVPIRIDPRNSVTSKTKFIAGIPMRGNYYQEAPTDENGCVVVCDEEF